MVIVPTPGQGVRRNITLTGNCVLGASPRAAWTSTMMAATARAAVSGSPGSSKAIEQLILGKKDIVLLVSLVLPKPIAHSDLLVFSCKRSEQALIYLLRHSSDVN